MAITVGILTGGSNSHQTTSEEANQISSDLISEGIVGAFTNTSGVAPATGAFAVNAQGSPDMTVAVSAGTAYVTATPSGQGSQTLRVKNSATSNVTISANSSGSTKYDWIYISVSAANAANPNSAADNVATLVASRSSSANTDDGTPPTYGYPLAVVTVANGASSITNGNIQDIRTRTGAYPDRTVADDGWRAVTDSWAYASATTITVPSDATTKYSVGDKIKLTQTTVKYFYIVGVASTTLTITGGSDYTLVNAAISSISYSKVATPLSFPQYLNFTPSYTNVTVGNGTSTGVFSMSGKNVDVQTSLTFGSTSAMSSTPSLTLPITSASLGSGSTFWLGFAYLQGSLGVVRWTSTTTVDFTVINTASTYGVQNGVTSTIPVSWTTGNVLTLTFRYRAA